MTPIAAVVVGVTTGLHIASWGAYKDVPYEGLHWRSFVRSPLVAAGVAVVLWYVTPQMRGLDLMIFVGIVYTAERLTVEWWKTILRDDDQSAYSIPMRLGFQGRPVDDPVARYGAGVAIAIGFGTACWVASAAQPMFAALPVGVRVGLAGISGWLIAAGGAWKDAPIEGFSAWKFLRSPVVATLWASPLLMLSSNWVLVTLAAGGLSVASIETYKTYLTGGRPPGKFASKTIQCDRPLARFVLTLIHGGTWATLFAALLIQFPWADPDSARLLTADEFARTWIVGVVGVAVILTSISGLRQFSRGRILPKERKATGRRQ